MKRSSTTRRKRPIGLLAVALIAMGMLLWIGPSNADPTPPDVTLVDQMRDGSGHCLDSPSDPACNVFDGPAYAWVGGDPLTGQLPDGDYFFTVLSPTDSPNPNDGSGASNLSDNFDTYTNREFTVDGGDVSSYTGTHDSDSGAGPGNSASSTLLKIRLSPYLPTISQAGVYQLALCLLGPRGGPYNYPVSNNQCRFDDFKVPEPDHDSPTCEHLEFGVDGDGHRWVKQKFTDRGGLDSLTVSNVTNATWNVQSFFRGTPGPVTMTATKLNQSLRSRILIWVRDVAGHVSQCDPVLATMHRTAQSSGTQRFSRLKKDESKIAIGNGRPGYRTLRIAVNGRHFRTVHLRAGQRGRFDARRLMRPGKHNSIVIRGKGAPGASADIVIAN